MIVFGAIVPHSPLLLPSIGKQHRDQLGATVNAYQEIEQALYLSKPDTLCVIAPHGAHYQDALSINLASKYVGNLKSFGDFSTTILAKSDYLLVDRIQRKLRAEQVPFTLSSSEELDYGFAIPLLLLTEHLPKWKLLPLSPSEQDGKTHFEFGRQLKRVIHAEDERVAVIASADLSHHVNAQSQGGATPEGVEFDRVVQEALSTQSLNAFIGMSPKTIEDSAQCGYRPIAMLFGMMDGMNIKGKILSYEAPFGVGYLTARFDVV